MLDIGIQELLALGLSLVFLVAVLERWRLRHSGPKVVVREFRLGDSTTAGEFLYILGRRAGLIAWILSLFGLQSQISFSATDDEVSRENVGLRGFESTYAPLLEITASYCQYYRAFWVLVLSLGFYLYGLMTFLLVMSSSNDYARQARSEAASYSLWACAILGTGCYVWYALSKRVSISVIVNGGVSMGISFKRSVMENVGVELRRAAEAVDLMNNRILAKRFQTRSGY